MTDDAALIRRYLDGSDDAFAEIVRRHIGAVYGTALRVLAGDAHLANDVTQKVFTDLARKASSLVDRPVIVGWLYQSTQYEAAKAVRSEQRWRNREQKAQAMQQIDKEGEPEPDWSALRPVIDSAMSDLKEGDRDALLLRFFQSHTFPEVGDALGLSENAARMRVDRALERLRAVLARRGIKSTAAALSSVMAGQLATAAPATLAATVVTTALAGTGAATGATLFFMGMTKLQTGIAAALVVAGGSVLWSENQAGSKLRAENAALAEQSAEVSRLKTENAKLEVEAQQAAILRNEAEALASLQSEADRLREELRTRAAAQRAAANARVSNNAVTSDGQAVLRLSELDSRPTPTVRIEPKYPAELKVLGLTGMALVSFVVSSDGTPKDLKIEQASHEAFGASALEAAKQWRFTPGMKAGVAVNTRVSVPFNFNLNFDDSGWF